MNTEVCKAFGDAIATQRNAMGLTQEELAAMVGLSARSIQRIEAGSDQQPRYETLFKIALALKTDPHSFIDPMWSCWLESASESDQSFTPPYLK